MVEMTEETRRVIEAAKQRTYLGDGVYSEWDGYDMLLIAGHNVIHLEPDVQVKLVQQFEKITELRERFR